MLLGWLYQWRKVSKIFLQLKKFCVTLRLK